MRDYHLKKLAKINYKKYYPPTPSMKWIELITVMSIPDSPLKPDIKLIHRMAETHKEHLKNIHFFRHSLMESDMAIHLYWNTSKSKPAGSDFGQELIQLLKEYGLVNHSVWNEDLS